MENKGTIYILALAVFLIGTIEYIITGIIEMMATDLGVSTAEAGMLVTVFALAAAIVAPILIAATINADRRKLLLLTFGVFIASNGIMMLDLSYEAMIWIRIIQGASGGMTTVVAMAAATRLVENEKRGNAIGIILMGLSSSLVLGVPIGTFFSEMIGWRMLFIVIGLLSVVPFLIIYRKVPSIRGQEKVTVNMQLSLLKNKSIIIALMMSLLYVGGYATLFTYITPFLHTTSSLTMTEISLILFLAGICSFIGSKLGGQLADARGSKFTILLGLVLQGLTLLLFAVTGTHLILLILVLMIFMLATWSISPAQQLYLVTLAPRSPDIALSLNTSFIQFGFALGSGLGGLVISRSSVLALNWAGFVAVGIAFGIAILQFRRASARQGVAASTQEINTH